MFLEHGVLEEAMPEWDTNVCGYGDSTPVREAPTVREEEGTNVLPVTNHHCQVSAFKKA